MRYVIVGAGIAGLTAAYKLLEKGHEVFVLEKEKEIGGLSKSFYYEKFVFDIGPHRFFTHSDKVYRFIISILKKDYIFVDRINSIYLLNKYFSWPLRPSLFVKLPFPIFLKVALSLFLRPKFEGRDFRSAVIRKYGKTLYELVFEDYTQKFCHIPCEKLDRNWMDVSFNKALIDKRIKMDSLFDLLEMTYKSMRYKTRFLYPKGGCGRFAKNLSEMIEDKGGQILTGIEDISIDFNKNMISSLRYGGCDNGTIEFDHLIYTASVTQLLQKLNLKTVDLEYLNSIIYSIEINRPLKNLNQWIYYGDKDITFARVSFPRNFDKNNVPNGNDSLCAELTCKNNSFLWNNPESIKERLLDDIIKVKLCQRQDIDAVHIEKIVHTYPLYKLNYIEELENAKKQLDNFCNLTYLGRTGAFWYNNMDESIEMALKVTDNIEEG